MLISGFSPAALARAGKCADGFLGAGVPPDQLQQQYGAGQAAGRSGQPRLVSLRYYRLGDETKQPAEAYLRDYYAFYRPMADQVVQGMLTTLEAIKGVAQSYEAVGCVRVNLDADGGRSQPG